MKTHEEHVRRVKKSHGGELNVVGQYVHSHVKVKYRCVHGHSFSSLPSNVEKGAGCKKCANDRHRITHEEHVRRVKAVHRASIMVVGRYVGANEKMEYACSEHGAFWARPANVTNGSGCMLCRNLGISRRTRKKHSVYVKEMRIRGFRVLDKYATAFTPLRHKCKSGHVWETIPNNTLNGHGCPLCDNSQYKKRPLQVGQRSVWVQGSEGTAVSLLLAEGVAPSDIAFTKKEGRPSFKYKFEGAVRTYVPDMLRLSKSQIIEVKSSVTLGMYDPHLLSQVRAKTRAAISAGFSFRLMLIHRRRNIDLGSDWHRKSFRDLNRIFRRLRHAQDLRYRRR